MPLATSAPSNIAGGGGLEGPKIFSVEIGTEIEIPAEGDIVAGIPGKEIEGRGTLCSLSALTNMLLQMGC